MAALEILDLHKTYASRSRDGQEITALRRVNLSIPSGELAVILGPASCGKSTLLNLIAGLDEPDSGTMRLDGVDIQTIPLEKRTLVFSNLTMLPWLDVRSNIELGLRMNHCPSDTSRRHAAHVMDRVGLSGYEMHLAHDLPPGLQQLTAIARALALNPDILLMDEPFTNLDAQTRLLLQKQLLRIWEEEPRTILFTTHDIDEAILLGGTVHLMTPRPGTIQMSIPVEIPHPRSHHAMVHPAFIQVKKQLMDILLV